MVRGSQSGIGEQNYCGRITFGTSLKYTQPQSQNQDTFTNAVYRYVQHVPMGFVTTYGRVAAVLGHPRSSRSVGTILSRNPHVGVVPCHRVVKADGDIGGYFGDNSDNARTMKMLILQGEGIPIVCVNGCYKVDMKRAFIY